MHDEIAGSHCNAQILYWQSLSLKGIKQTDQFLSCVKLIKKQHHLNLQLHAFMWIVHIQPSCFAMYIQYHLFFKYKSSHLTNTKHAPNCMCFIGNRTRLALLFEITDRSAACIMSQRCSLPRTQDVNKHNTLWQELLILPRNPTTEPSLVLAFAWQGGLCKNTVLWTLLS